MTTLNEREVAALKHVDGILKQNGELFQVSERHIGTLKDLATRARVLFFSVQHQKERMFSRQGLTDLKEAYPER
ncbi:MAG: hypothetical protein V1834_04220 [Candidatus Micrarchaeota archaeon]